MSNAQSTLPPNRSRTSAMRDRTPEGSTRSSGSSTANACSSGPSASRTQPTAWPRPSGSAWVTVRALISSWARRTRGTSFSLPRAARVFSSSDESAKCAAMASFPGEVTISSSSAPASAASAATSSMPGVSTTGRSSFGTVLVVGRKRVPRPAAGTTAERNAFMACDLIGAGTVRGCLPTRRFNLMRRTSGAHGCSRPAQRCPRARAAPTTRRLTTAAVRLADGRGRPRLRLRPGRPGARWAVAGGRAGGGGARRAAADRAAGARSAGVGPVRRHLRAGAAGAAGARGAATGRRGDRAGGAGARAGSGRRPGRGPARAWRGLLRPDAALRRALGW